MEEIANHFEWILLAIALIAIIVVSSLLIYRLIEKKRKEAVKQYSYKYQEICRINQLYDFRAFAAQEYAIEYYYKSKHSLEKADINETAAFLMYNDADLRMVIQAIQYNRELYPAYENEIAGVEDTLNSSIYSSRVKIKKFLQLERELCDEAIKHPRLNMDVAVYLRYTSDKGRNSYLRDVVFSIDEAKTIIDRYTKRELIKMQAKLERAKMNDSLRYEVLKRDGFRCTICGATAQDGVKLHVDHIFPVSKGGRTVMSNLRTLCDRCNLGKKDKYEFGGLN